MQKCHDKYIPGLSFDSTTCTCNHGNGFTPGTFKCITFL